MMQRLAWMHHLEMYVVRDVDDRDGERDNDQGDRNPPREIVGGRRARRGVVVTTGRLIRVPIRLGHHYGSCIPPGHLVRPSGGLPTNILERWREATVRGCARS